MIEINDQFQFFQNVKLDDEGNLLVSIVGASGGTGNDYTTKATLAGTVLSFDRTDLANAYSVDLSSIAGGGGTFGVNLDAGYPGSVLMSPNYECGLVGSIPVDTIDGGGI